MQPSTETSDYTKPSSQASFIDAMLRYPRCAPAKDAPRQRLHRDDALKFPHIQLNSRGRKAFLVFDVDRAGAAFSWEEAGLPAPTVIVVNPENGHAHLIYQLAAPVYYNSAHRDARKNKPMGMYKRIRAGYADLLGADPGYHDGDAKNPLHPKWWKIWAERTYSLDELIEGYPGELPLLKPTRIGRAQQAAIDDSVVVTEGCRNETLFDRTRYFAYSVADRAPTHEALYSNVLEFARHQNAAFVPPLRDSDVKAMARSITNWTWPKRGTIHSRNHEARSPEITKASRQRGMESARDARRNDLLERIALALDEADRDGTSFSFSDIAARAGTGYRSVRNHAPAVIATQALAKCESVMQRVADVAAAVQHNIATMLATAARIADLRLSKESALFVQGPDRHISEERDLKSLGYRHPGRKSCGYRVVLKLGSWHDAPYIKASAPYEARNVLKRNGFRWDLSARRWYTTTFRPVFRPKAARWIYLRADDELRQVLDLCQRFGLSLAGGKRMLDENSRLPIPTDPSRHRWRCRVNSEYTLS